MLLTFWFSGLRYFDGSSQESRLALVVAGEVDSIPLTSFFVVDVGDEIAWD